jgi:putative oxidoreductase
MTFVPLIGRVLFALIFLVASPRHFKSEGIAHAAELGVPLVGALSVMTGYYPKWGARALVAFLVPVTLGMHAFWSVSDPIQRHVQEAMFAKNISMLGAALLITFFGSGPLSLRDP